jgi:hypothetical protein
MAINQPRMAEASDGGNGKRGNDKNENDNNDDYKDDAGEGEDDVVQENDEDDEDGMSENQGDDYDSIIEIPIPVVEERDGIHDIDEEEEEESDDGVPRGRIAGFDYLHNRPDRDAEEESDEEEQWGDIVDLFYRIFERDEDGDTRSELEMLDMICQGLQSIDTSRHFADPEFIARVSAPMNIRNIRPNFADPEITARVDRLRSAFSAFRFGARMLRESLHRREITAHNHEEMYIVYRRQLLAGLLEAGGVVIFCLLILLCHWEHNRMHRQDMLNYDTLMNQLRNHFL